LLFGQGEFGVAEFYLEHVDDVVRPVQQKVNLCAPLFFFRFLVKGGRQRIDPADSQRSFDRWDVLQVKGFEGVAAPGCFDQ
jgi:hypothetical protein